MGLNNTPKNWVAIDGAVNIETYKEETFKILWVLREPNGSDFDFQKYLQDPRVYKRWKSSYGLVVKVSHAILNNLKIDEDKYPYPPNIPEIMKRISLINLKKTGGASKIDVKKIKEYVNNHIPELKKQLNELSPDLIIFAGSMEFLPKTIMESIQEITGKATQIIDAYHPNQKTISHKAYVKNILANISR